MTNRQRETLIGWAVVLGLGVGMTVLSAILERKSGVPSGIASCKDTECGCSDQLCQWEHARDSDLVRFFRRLGGTKLMPRGTYRRFDQ